MYLK
ncbi:uncharacterized protein FFE2_16060 [Fusarium fujikuroi]|jgi:hypothetical protein